MMPSVYSVCDALGGFFDFQTECLYVQGPQGFCVHKALHALYDLRVHLASVFRQTGFLKRFMDELNLWISGNCGL